MLRCFVFGLSQFPNRLEVVSLRLSSCLAAFISYATAVQGPFEVFGKQRQKQARYPGFIGKPCFSWPGWLEGMPPNATWMLASLKTCSLPVLTDYIFDVLIFCLLKMRDLTSVIHN